MPRAAINAGCIVDFIIVGWFPSSQLARIPVHNPLFAIHNDYIRLSGALR